MRALVESLIEGFSGAGWLGAEWARRARGFLLTTPPNVTSERRIQGLTAVVFGVFFFL